MSGLEVGFSSIQTGLAGSHDFSDAMPSGNGSAGVDELQQMVSAMSNNAADNVNPAPVVVPSTPGDTILNSISNFSHKINTDVSKLLSSISMDSFTNPQELVKLQMNMAMTSIEVQVGYAMAHKVTDHVETFLKQQ